MKNSYSIRVLLDQIEELEREIEDGQAAWEAGDDPCAMAACDPSDQYVKGEEIIKLVEELKSIVAEL